MPPIVTDCHWHFHCHSLPHIATDISIATHCHWLWLTFPLPPIVSDCHWHFHCHPLSHIATDISCTAKSHIFVPAWNWIMFESMYGLNSSRRLGIFLIFIVSDSQGIVLSVTRHLHCLRDLLVVSQRRRCEPSYWISISCPSPTTWSAHSPQM